MPLQECSSSENLRGPSERSWTSRAVHLAPMISAQAATAQVADSWTAFMVRAEVAIARIVDPACEDELKITRLPCHPRRVMSGTGTAEEYRSVTTVHAAPAERARGSSIVLLTLASGQFLMTLDSSVMNV